MPHLELLFPYEFYFSFSEAQATETQPEETSSQTSEQDGTQATNSETPPPPEEASAAASEGEGESTVSTIPQVSFKVDDFTGAAHLTYPIAVPPGRKGIAPKLFLTYNSGQGNGWMGVGWNLGIGAIQRSTKYGVNYDANDYVAVVNGSSSELLARTDWGANHYGDKIEGAVVKYYRDPSTGGWEVTTNEGTKYYYGGSPDSRQDSEKGIFKWCLDKVVDTKGNYMTITYSKDQGEVYLDRIDYTGNPVLTPTNYVKFHPDPQGRTDIPNLYPGNSIVKTARRLKTIETYSNGLLQRKYVLNYGYSSGTGRSLINKVTVYGSDGITPLPDTTFGWSQAIGLQDKEALLSGKHAGFSYRPKLIRAMDLNGDGKTDVLLGPDVSGNWYAILSTGSGLQDQGVWLAGSYAEFYNTPEHIHPMDLNGDGKTDVLLGPDLNGNWYAILSTGDGLSDQRLWLTGYPEFYALSDLIRPMDLNGDGKTDVLLGPNVSGNWYAILSTGSGLQDQQEAWLTGTYAEFVNKPNLIRPMDLNGDGKTDLLLGPNVSGQWFAILSTGDGLSDQRLWLTGYPEFYGRPNLIHPMDLNGDGKTDVLLGPDLNGNWYAILSTGSGLQDQQETWLTGYPGFYALSYLIHPMDLNGDGKTDVLLGPDVSGKWYAILSTGSGLQDQQEAWLTGSYANFVNKPNLIRPIDLNGDGKTDVLLGPNVNGNWYVLQADGPVPDGPVPDLLTTISNGIGGASTITYTPSSAWNNTLLPSILQTVSCISADDGRGNILSTTHTYEGGLYDYPERELWGFKKATSYQMADSESYESMTETTFHQDYYLKGKIQTQTITSKPPQGFTEGHTRRVDNVWVVQDNGNGTRFPRLDEATSTITDVGEGGPFTYSHRGTYSYDSYFNVSEEHKWHLEGTQWVEDIRTYFAYSNFFPSKPTDIKVTDPSGNIVGRKWMDYDSNTGNILTEEVCKSNAPNTGCVSRNATQNSVITNQYYADGNLWKITDPRNYTTTINYDATKTFVYETTNTLGHKTTTEYDPGTGNLTKLIPPHIQGTGYWFTYTYDVLGRKDHEYRPDGGWTWYTYPSLTDPNNRWGDPYTQHLQKQEHIIGGSSPLDHYTYAFFDGLNRTYWVSSTGPDGKSIITETQFDNLGRIWRKYNPRFDTDSPPYPFTELTYDGLSRVIETAIPDDQDPSGFTYISTTYQGLKKVVTDQRGYSTASTYDVYQRLKKVEDTYGTITEYSYDTLGNLLQVIAAKGNTEQNTTTMTYDSLSKKKTMTDPDMGSWTYQYDKAGNLELQTDNKGQKIRFKYDGLNRVYEKRYGDPTPTSTVYFTYDDPAVPNSKGKLTKVSYQPSGEDLREDAVLEYDLMQRVKKGRKKIGADSATFENTYDTAGRTVSMKYLAGTPNEKVYSYEYNVAGNVLYVKDNSTGNYLVDYSDFTALGQHRIATFPKPNGVSVKSTYTYYPRTTRLNTLLTQKLVGGSPTDTYQNLHYHEFDGAGNIKILEDIQNNITHNYTYDHLNRLTLADGVGTNSYTQSYQYDRIGNITFKSDVGNYSYTYSSKPHAVRTAGNISLQYDNNGNMTQRSVSGGIRLDLTYTYDNKPNLIKKNGSNYVKFTYDGNSQRVKKYNYNTGQTTLYFGELYETRGGAGTMHIFAGGKRVASVLADGRTQFYHANHLGSASVITDQNGDKKERIEYFPFGTYRETVDYDGSFPDVFYTFTGQEDDDDLGLYNFKARLYDPVLARFISPDRLIPDPGDLQAFNRYTYCLNNPLIYTDPSGEFYGLDILIYAAIVGAVLGAASGAYQAHRSGGVVWQGALIGAAIGGVSGAVGSVVGGVVAGAVTSWLAPTVGTAAAESIGNVVGAMAGGFTAGSTSGGATAAVYGGNVWKGALYGGLIGAAVAGTVAGAIELGGWAISSGSPTNQGSNPDTSDMFAGPGASGENVNLKPEDILHITNEKEIAQEQLQTKHYVKIFRLKDRGNIMGEQIRQIGAGHKATDFLAEAYKFRDLHVRLYPEAVTFHWDQVALNGSIGNFARHVWSDMVRNAYYAIKDKGFFAGLAEAF